MVKNVGYLLAQERRDDCWRCFVGTQTVSVGSTHDRSLQQTIVLVYTHQRLDDEHHEAQVVLRCLAWTVEQNARISRKTPVVVLTGTVDTVERLFVKQYLEAVLAGYFLHQAHQQHVVVNSQVGLFEDRSALKLVRSHLVVACLARNAQLKSLDLKILHESLHTLRNRSEVVVVHLLVLGRAVAHQRAAGQHEVRTCGIEVLVDEEVLLLPSQVADTLLHVGIEIMTNIGSGNVHSMESAQQRCLVVKGLTGVRNEDRRDTQCVVDDKHR